MGSPVVVIVNTSVRAKDPSAVAPVTSLMPKGVAASVSVLSAVALPSKVSLLSRKVCSATLAEPLAKLPLNCDIQLAAPIGVVKPLRWPGCYDELWTRLQGRHGKQNGTRAMVAVLALGQEFGHDRLRTAVAATVSLGACDVAAVWYLGRASEWNGVLS